MAARSLVARPVAVDERELTLAFPADAAFLKRKAEQDELPPRGGGRRQDVTGRLLALRYELAREPERRTARAGATEEEFVRRFVEEFDAEEILDDPDEAAES